MKEESLLLLSDLQKLINQVVLIDYTIIILGGEEYFPLVTLSIAMISNRNYTFRNMSEFSGELVKKKKAAKHTEGNSIQIL